MARTSNGGTTWQLAPSITFKQLNAIHCPTTSGSRFGKIEKRRFRPGKERGI